MIKRYLQQFGNLRTDKARNRYPALTFHRAPHKPFLLLSVMDLIAQGIITENFIEPSFDLVDNGSGQAKKVEIKTYPCETCKNFLRDERKE